jgi:hypothetical protein
MLVKCTMRMFLKTSYLIVVWFVFQNLAKFKTLETLQPSLMIVGKDRGPYYKILRIHNVLKMAKFHGKLVFLAIVSHFHWLSQTH